MKRIVKHLANGVCRLCMLFPCAAARIGTKLWHSDRSFLYFAQSASLVPGTAGECIRRAYYRGTLEHVGADLVVGFGSFFTHRAARLGDGVWIGQYSIIGRACIEANVLVSDHVSILSGRHHHAHDDGGRLVEHETSRASIAIGAHSWIGAGATIMADIGEGAIVGAGSVVVHPVPRRAVVAGNPAKEIRRAESDATS